MANPISFQDAFQGLTGNVPFPWQQAFYERMIAGKIPSSCNLPTGVGKTSIIPIWLIAIAAAPASVPRRLVYVVNRRTVVDQATDETVEVRRRLIAAETPALVQLVGLLKGLASLSSSVPLAISTLRGQFADNGQWRADPSRPAVIVGTVDMIGSRLLFSGYGLGFKSRPLHAGFLGQDSLIVHDEAHLEPAFQELLVTVRKEQTHGRTPDRWPLRIMELTATSRAQEDRFELTPEEQDVPEVVPAKPNRPVEVVWRRLKAPKSLHLTPAADEKEVVAKMIELAIRHKDSQRTILVFASTLKAVEEIRKSLTSKGKVPGENVLPLTGTMRGRERDRMANEHAVFARFYRRSKAKAATGTVYLVSTSAGEVGVDISADHLVSDLTPFDSMAQRFGRVNRYGDLQDTRIDVVYPTTFGKKDSVDKVDQRRQKTLELLQRLRGDASPRALGALDPGERVEAFTPTPKTLLATDILLDAWALTTIAPPLVRTSLPGRPPVEPYLHGISDWQPPETYVAWREEVGVFNDDLRHRYGLGYLEDLLEDYPLKSHEVLRDRSDRVFTHLAALADRRPEDNVWILDSLGKVEVLSLRQLADKDDKDRIAGQTVLLSPTSGGLGQDGLIDGSSDWANDVADDIWDAHGKQRRARVWDSDEEATKKTAGMRRIRAPIDAFPDAGDDAELGETPAQRYWSWYERPAVAEGDGSRTAEEPIDWESHVRDVERLLNRILQSLLLVSDECKVALTLAARFHDLGKRREVWQRSIGNPNPIWLAKSGKGMKPRDICPDYRHELGSLVDIPNESDFQRLPDDLKPLVLHLIAAHHGRGRPHFPPRESFDPEPKGCNPAAIAAEVPQRFARLQREWGRWGLAYLESLLRAADWAASASPCPSQEYDL
jgi:CRISPR-associated endonuclease/helicase Cas3